MCELCNLFKKLCNTLNNKESHLCYVEINLSKKIKGIMKNVTELKGDWNETKGKLKQKFAKLTDSDLLLIEGKQTEMLGRLQIRLGKTEEEIQKLISQL